MRSQGAALPLAHEASPGDCQGSPALSGTPAVQEAEGAPQEGVGSRFQLPLLGQVREEQVSVVLLLKASGKSGPS